MLVREIMTTNVECVAPETTIHEAAKKMEALDVGFLPICQNDRLIGTVTDRDIVLRAVADGRGLSTMVRDIMTADVFYCFEDDDIESCADHMKEKEVKRLLILNRSKRLVGVVSLGDLSKVHEEAAGDALRDISDAA